ncbi:XapX domain-containing protein [Burkholderia pyrrocinia]|uniref:XapX domain-containing protein n=1 Tax=Burkholderia pyrrocinia TaxID=60550 RepID=UPI00215A89F3|nr:XapX domain-containing protein [Burkholderia pyrrocinia]UVE66657.1 XapX domain-containing protein [Burkholderia pyrrocinia]
MMDYATSFAVGLGVLYALPYALLHVCAPAPSLVALVGLLGMVIGERATALLR